MSSVDDYRARWQARRRRRGRFPLLIAALVLLAAIGVAVWLWPRGNAAAWASGSPTAVMPRLTALPGRLAITSAEGALRLLRLESGEPLWPRPWTTPLALSPAGCDGVRLYVGDSAGGLYAIDPAASAVIWEQQTGAALRTRPVAGGDRVYIGADDGSVHAFDAATGRSLWKVSLGSAVGADPALADQILICPTVANGVLGVQAADGVVLWQTQMPVAVLTPPVVVGDAALVAADDGSLCEIAVATGEVRYAGTLDGIARAAPLVEGGMVYAATMNGWLYAWRYPGWELLWRRRSAADFTSGLACDASSLCIGDSQGRLRRIDRSDGRVVGGWRCPAAALGELVLSDGCLAAGLEDGRTVAFRVGG
jgi:outer membrane protein assembly factor BamB